MTPDAAAKLLDLYGTYNSAVNELWGLFATVALAAVGLVFSEIGARAGHRLKIALSVGFGCFAFGNHEALARSQSLLSAVARQIHALAPQAPTDLKPIFEAAKMKSYCVIMGSHYFFAGLVIVAIWIPALLQSSHLRDPSPKAG